MRRRSTLGAVHSMVTLRHRREKAAAGMVFRTGEGLMLALDGDGRAHSLMREQAEELMTAFPGQFFIYEPARELRPTKPHPADGGRAST